MLKFGTWNISSFDTENALEWSDLADFLCIKYLPFFEPNTVLDFVDKKVSSLDFII